MLTAAPEPFAPFLEEVMPLLPAHYAELALDQDKVPLSPQYDEYLRRDELGQVMCIAMRDAGKLVGYFIGFKAPGLHYSTCLTLIQDIFWLHPDHRGKGGGFILFEAVKREMKRHGIQRGFFGSKTHLPADWLFERVGFTKVETYYSFWAGEE